jgi:hypothetical protein
MDQRVRRVIDKSDIVLEVVDARQINGTRSKDIENAVAKAGKKLVIVVNKSDLARPEEMPENAVLLCARDKKGSSRLRRLINMLAKQLKLESVRVGVVGYANTGKSSVINALGGSAPTSSTPGFTKGEHWARISKNILLLDSPGLIPYREEGELELALKAAYEVKRMKDPIAAAEELIRWLGPDRVARAYEMEQFKEPDEQLSGLARKWLMLLKGGELDLDRASRRLLKDWQRGILR